MGFFNLEDFILWSKRTPRWWRTLFRLYRIVEEISSEEILWSLTFLTKKDDNLDNLHKTTFPKAQEYCREKNLKFDFIFHMWHVRYLTCSISYVYKLFKWLKMKKSVKIKTWFTKEEVLKFSSFFYDTELDANMIRYGGSKSTSKFLFDDKIRRVLFFGPEKCLKEFKSRVGVAPKSRFWSTVFSLRKLLSRVKRRFWS